MERESVLFGLEELLLLKHPLQSQCNPYQNSSGIFHRNRKKKNLKWIKDPKL